MALTRDQLAQLAELEAERDAPPVRTDTGLPGILHALIDLTSGRVAHVSPEVVDDLHAQAEELAGQDQAKPAEEQPAEDHDGDDQGAE